jgi:hypothetical protein
MLRVDTVKGMEFLPRYKDGIPQTGFNENWWLGVELLHTLFALEHNTSSAPNCRCPTLPGPVTSSSTLLD